MTIEDPLALLGRLRLGREEYCQRLLTQLILDDGYPRWNTESTPSADGLQFLAMLEELSFGAAGPWRSPVYVDELDLPRRHDAEKGCAPDLALRDEQRLWLVELKTEAGSHRADQLPAYFELARHHFPGHRIDLTYLTGPLSKPGPVVPVGCRYAHVTWDQVLPLVDTVWGELPGVHGETADMLQAVLKDLGAPWRSWRDTRLGVAAVVEVTDPVAAALALARATGADHQQRALHHRPGSLEALQQLRLDVAEAIRSAGAATLNVRPWLWQVKSGGRPLTVAGDELGYELRLSWYVSPTGG
jgi:hypothetical protein